jgi:hypothetical protein
VWDWTTWCVFLSFFFFFFFSSQQERYFVNIVACDLCFSSNDPSWRTAPSKISLEWWQAMKSNALLSSKKNKSTAPLWNLFELIKGILWE